MTLRYPAGCAAQEGGGVDIGAACFTFMVHECMGGRNGRTEVSEIFGYFREPGTIDDDMRLGDALVTHLLEVRRNSRIARLARQIVSDSTTRPEARVGEVLRVNVLLCPCPGRGVCPAVNKASFIRAMEHAFD